MDDSRIDFPGGVALHASRLVIEDDLFAPRVTVNGQLRLAGARVGGVVLLDKAMICVEGGGRAVYAAHLSVGLRLLARHGFTAIGETYLSGAMVGTNLDFRGAVLKNPESDALLAHGIQVGGFLSFEDNALVQGTVRMSRAKVGGEIYFSDGRFINPGKDAIRCRDAEAKRAVFGPGFTAEGTADFRHSRFSVIRDDQSSWPPELRLSGLRYDALDPPLPAAKRVAWLSRDTDGYVPQDYETLAAMYRRNGDDAAARTVLLARERARREQLPWYGRAWSLLQEVSVGYGYRPLRAGAWLAAFFGLGTLVFGLHHPPPLAGAPHPAFNSLIYTLDLLVPLVNFGLRDTYDPQGPQRWLAYLLIAVGWIFATTIAAGIARVLRRN
ncbi:MAG: membrane-associated oxidoreductase [Nocardiopsaceae bacterium]|nr:membrane-associated oxidoreductase [Nocardiopsaceae bacterium]